MAILQDILDWAKGLPPWQGDAVARLFAKQNLAQDDLEARVGRNNRRALRRMNNSVAFAPYLLIKEDIYSSVLRTYYERGSNHSEIFMVQCTAFIAPYELDLPEESASAPTYSNIGIGLLGHFLTLKTGEDLEALLNQYVLSPLGMKHTVIALKPEDKPALAIGYAGDQPLFIPRNSPLDNWEFSPVMLATGGVYSTAEDLIKYLKGHLGKSRTQLDNALQKSRKILGKDGSHFLTMGWYVDYLPEYKTYLYYYHGMISGFNCYIGFEPETQVAVVVLRNNFNWEDVVGHNLLLRMSRYARHKKSKLLVDSGY